MEDQLSGLNPAAYAPYGNPREYITSWTDKIWIARGLGHLRDHYAPHVKVHTAYGETYGFDHVMRNSIQRMVAFPNRGGGHDDVIWERRGDNGFVSAHRVMNNATHLGPWTYGPATGKNWVNRGMAHCHVQDNMVVEEWVVRDEFAVLQDLGLDPYAIAGELLKKSPVLGKAMNAAESPVFAGRIADPRRVGISGPRPDRYGRECDMILEYFEEVWNGRFFDRYDDIFDETCAVQTVRLRRAMGIAPCQLELMNLLAFVPDGQVEVRDISVHESFDLGLRIGVIWLIRGTYSGTPHYGPINNAPLNILGSSHFEFRRGKIVREYRIFDEIAVIAQILAGGGREAKAPY